MFSTVLVANRGEIACRVIRACRALGIRAVAVYSEADRDAPHVRMADAAFLLGPPPALQSYLNQDRVLAAAHEAGADAIHPGYGFLSENAEFAQRCSEDGLVFVGPSASAIATMGDKLAARRLASACGVPIVPGTSAAVADAEAARLAAEIGYPIMVKASAGGGGIGMNVVNDAAGLAAALRTARSRAARAFASADVYLERYIPRARHVEVQVFADCLGTREHLFERECSVQRRYQKVIEEAPSPLLDRGLRERMTASALELARAVDYANAGTVECVVDPLSREFYFLEMNTRLQVEHPVTEAITGCDLVQAQLRVAAGEPMPWKQADLSARGHAIECRIYAEDPVSMLPSPGRVTRYVEPTGVRVDSGIDVGSEVMVYYDPLLAKVIAWGESRPQAISRMIDALEAFEIDGVRTNIPLHLRVLRDDAFVSGDYDTSLLQRLKDIS
jgi:acetyl-CoA carboxylase biotin carboxylase subunit